MNHPGFGLQRRALLSLEQLHQIEEATLRILEEVGILVLDDAAREKLASAGLRVSGERVYLDRETVRAFIEEERATNGHLFGEEPAEPHPQNSTISLGIISYPQHVHDPDCDEVIPFTTELLIEASKLLDTLSDRGVTGCIAGLPTDVPEDFQPVLQYWIAATHAKNGRRPTDIKSIRSMPYAMEMAELMGHPIEHMPVYVFTPLKLCGESLSCVLAARSKLAGVYVTSMPGVGSTAPIQPGDAFALAAAEVIGSAMLVRELSALPVDWSVQIFPTDMRSLAMIFGSPESLLFQLMSSEVNAYLHGAPWYPAADNIHTNAKLPGPQSCAEKSGIMAAGALLGSRSFSSAGALSLDEVFSGEQLLYDLEIKDHVERLVKGMDGSCDPARCLEDVAQGLRENSFLGLGTTSREHRDLYWSPELFDRDFLGAWRSQGTPLGRDEARAQIRELLKQHEYCLEKNTQKELDQILDRARKALT